MCDRTSIAGASSSSGSSGAGAVASPAAAFSAAALLLNSTRHRRSGQNHRKGHRALKGKCIALTSTLEDEWLELLDGLDGQGAREALEEEGLDYQHGPSKEDLQLEALRCRQEKINAILAARRLRNRRMRASSRNLSDSWQLVMHVSSGKWYYYNEDTGQTSWDVPEGAEVVAERPSEPCIPWSLVLDPSVGKWYYWNKETGVTSWDALEEKETPVPWRQILHPTSGELCYWNEETGITSWDPPGTTVNSAPPSGQGKTAWWVVLLGSEKKCFINEDTGEALCKAPDGAPLVVERPPQPPEPWKLVLHPSSHEWCYRNEETGETLWEPPPRQSFRPAGTARTVVRAA